MMWGKNMMWGEILHDVAQDFWMMWGEIMRLYDDVG